MRTNKKIVRLTESRLRNIIAESVKDILKENSNNYLPREIEECYYRHNSLLEKFREQYERNNPQDEYFEECFRELCIAGKNYERVLGQFIREFS